MPVGVVAQDNHVVHALRDDLLQGRFAPGTPLRLAALAESYEASTTTVREALLRLSERNLVTLTPNAGFRVKDVSAEDLDDLTDLRVLIESEAFRLSIARGDRAWEARIVAAFHLLDQSDPRPPAELGTTDEWARAHAEFHHALIAACGRPRMLNLADALRDGAELYRQLSVAATIESGRDVRDEHRQLRDAALNRDAGAAADLLESHLRRTSDLIRPVLGRRTA